MTSFQLSTLIVSTNLVHLESLKKSSEMPSVSVGEAGDASPSYKLSRVIRWVSGGEVLPIKIQLKLTIGQNIHVWLCKYWIYYAWILCDMSISFPVPSGGGFHWYWVIWCTVICSKLKTKCEANVRPFFGGICWTFGCCKMSMFLLNFQCMVSYWISHMPYSLQLDLTKCLFKLQYTKPPSRLIEHDRTINAKWQPQRSQLSFQS